MAFGVKVVKRAGGRTEAGKRGGDFGKAEILK